MANFLDYFIQNLDYILSLTLQHLQLTIISVFTAILIGVPLGILISYIKVINKPVLAFTNVLQSIPSIALLGFLIPFLGIGNVPAIFMVVIYSLLPIIKNTYAGLNNIDKDLIEAASGIGMTKLQILLKVKLPLALPIIMAGIRISSVTAVGLVTVAAFIGSGGLGQLVYAGIRTLDNNQILAGAIPVCIIALLIDFLVATIEKYVTPVSLQNNATAFDKKQIARFNKMKYLVLSLTFLLVLSVFVYSVAIISKPTSNVIVIGSKADTETEILAHMYATLIETHTDLTVVRRFGLGGTNVVFNSLINGEIDLYVEYTGTAYTVILNHTEIKNAQDTFDIVQQELQDIYDIKVLLPIGFNNTYALAIRQDTATEFGLKTISDLALVAPQLTFSPTFEFMHREDGFIGLQTAYGLTFNNVIAMDGAARYTALVNDQSQVIDAFSTDGLIFAFDLVLLEDDLSFFPPYYAIPIIRKDTAYKHPEVLLAIDMLQGLIDETIIVELNYKVDVLNKRPQDVATEFLKQNNLI